MSEAQQLIVTLKKLLKAQGMTYADVAERLKLSEPTVKRLFSSGRLTVDRLEQLSHIVGYTLAELSKEAVHSQTRLTQLSEAQEKELVSDVKLLLVAVCVLNQWTMEEILRYYQLSEPECIRYLLKLDKLRIIDLLPNNRIRLNVSRDFDWIPYGPIRRHFKARVQDDFLQCAFDKDDEMLSFAPAMLTEHAMIEMQEELRRVRQRFVALHEESLKAPLSKRRGVAMLLAMRAWEPASFLELKK